MPSTVKCNVNPELPLLYNYTYNKTNYIMLVTIVNSVYQPAVKYVIKTDAW